jgi:hypothetical protein
MEGGEWNAHSPWEFLDSLICATNVGGWSGLSKKEKLEKRNEAGAEI